jgi:DNA-binding MarR family transcriptional regulator
MFVRVKRSGRHEYLQLVENQRIGGGVKQRVLVTLGQYGMMTGKAIGSHSHMHKTKVSRAVALLERRKLVARRPNRADMREAFLSLTPAGREIYGELAPIAIDFARQLLETVDAGDRAALDRHSNPADYGPTRGDNLHGDLSRGGELKIESAGRSSSHVRRAGAGQITCFRGRDVPASGSDIGQRIDSAGVAGGRSATPTDCGSCKDRAIRDVGHFAGRCGGIFDVGVSDSEFRVVAMRMREKDEAGPGRNTWSRPRHCGERGIALCSTGFVRRGVRDTARAT